jgi:hypothetical protein
MIFGSPVRMRSEDVATIGALVTKAQAGRRLVPSGGYRYFQFNQPLDADPPANTSRGT